MGRRQAMFVEEGSFSHMMMWCSKEMLLTRITPKLWICAKGDRVELSMVRQMLWVVLVRDFGPLIIVSDLSQFSLRKLACIHDLITVRHLITVECVTGMMDLVEM